MRESATMDAGDEVIERWSRWIEELASHPLDRFEYEGLLECRDRVAELLRSSSGDSVTVPMVDAADAEFERLTIAPGSEPRLPAEAWWRSRVPADPAWRQYLDR